MNCSTWNIVFSAVLAAVLIQYQRVMFHVEHCMTITGIRAL